MGVDNIITFLGSRPEKAARRCGAVLCLSGFSLPSVGTTEGTGCLGKPPITAGMPAAPTQKQRFLQ